ncbi:MAG: transaldolase [Tropheryma whipplei]|nr:transaldolase [Tropheryma whipplei]
MLCWEGVVNSLQKLSTAGVSVWLDDLSRSRITDGDLKKRIEKQCVVGVTTNPSIFAKSIASSRDYDSSFKNAFSRGCTLDEAVLSVISEDVSGALDLLADSYSASKGIDGRVSIEVDPTLAYDTEGTFRSVKSIWESINKPNLYVKIPATREGLEAISQSIASGVCVNVTLIFSLQRYREVIDAYLTGLERAVEAGRSIENIFSVASFFVSRFDVYVDEQLDNIGTPQALHLKGRAAVANARLAYEVYEEAFATPRYKILADKGANKQRPLWASTGVKNPRYPDTCYVTNLVARDVVNTMPEATLDAMNDHGEIRGDTITGTYEDSRAILSELAKLGVNYTEVTDKLEADGVKQFIDSWNQLKSNVRSRF